MPMKKTITALLCLTLIGGQAQITNAPPVKSQGLLEAMLVVTVAAVGVGFIIHLYYKGPPTTKPVDLYLLESEPGSGIWTTNAYALQVILGKANPLDFFVSAPREDAMLYKVKVCY